jgi:hypothetical protein
MTMKKLIMIALLGALFSCFAFGDFIFTDLYNSFGKVMIGGYFALMAYQILSPYPIVLESNRLPAKIAGIQYGPFIYVASDLEANYKEQVIAHELEHLYQEATINFCAAAILRGLEYARAAIEGDAYKDNMWEVLARKAELRYINGEVIFYWKLTIEF